MVIRLELNCKSVVVYLLGVEFVAIQKYLIDIAMKLCNVFIFVGADLFFDSLQVHRFVNDFEIIGNSLGDGVYWLPKRP